MPRNVCVIQFYSLSSRGPFVISFAERDKKMTEWCRRKISGLRERQLKAISRQKRLSMQQGWKLKCAAVCVCCWCGSFLPSRFLPFSVHLHSCDCAEKLLFLFWPSRCSTLLPTSIVINYWNRIANCVRGNVLVLRISWLSFIRIVIFIILSSRSLFY